MKNNVFVKIQKKKLGGSGGGGRVGGGVRVDVNEELKFLRKFKKKNGGGWVGGVGLGGSGWWGVRVDENDELKFFFFWGGEGGRGGQVGGSGGRGGWVRVDVTAMLGVGGDVGYGGCEPRIEGIVQCTKRYCTILRK